MVLIVAVYIITAELTKRWFFSKRKNLSWILRYKEACFGPYYWEDWRRGVFVVAIEFIFWFCKNCEAMACTMVNNLILITCLAHESS
jgi:hypothetical protein